MLVQIVCVLTKTLQMRVTSLRLSLAGHCCLKHVLTLQLSLKSVSFFRCMSACSRLSVANRLGGLLYVFFFVVVFLRQMLEESHGISSRNLQICRRDHEHMVIDRHMAFKKI